MQIHLCLSVVSKDLRNFRFMLHEIDIGWIAFDIWISINFPNLSLVSNHNISVLMLPFLLSISIQKEHFNLDYRLKFVLSLSNSFVPSAILNTSKPELALNINHPYTCTKIRKAFIRAKSHRLENMQSGIAHKLRNKTYKSNASTCELMYNTDFNGTTESITFFVFKTMSYSYFLFVSMGTR